MYSKADYLRRGFRFINNNLRPAHKTLSTLMFYATDACNSRCKHCLIWAKNPVVHMPKSKIIEVMGSKCVSKHTTIGLEGGEFLLHPEAMEILKWFSENHNNFDLLSNCLDVERTIDAVKRFPPKRLFLSLDGDRNTYLFMRGKDGYDSVIKVIEACKSIVPISLMFTLSPYNDFAALNHVVDVAKKYDIDVRIGVYNDIAYFSTVDKAHETEIGTAQKDETPSSYRVVKDILKQAAAEKNSDLKEKQVSNLHDPKHDISKIESVSDFKQSIPANVLDTSENYDFLLLYDEWRHKKLKLKCYSILDELVIHPGGNIPICQNLDVILGNVNDNTLDEIFNSAKTIELQKRHVHNCNQCWINFHRKYDIVLLRNAEKIMPKKLIELFYGNYCWTDKNISYKKFLKQYQG